MTNWHEKRRVTWLSYAASQKFKKIRDLLCHLSDNHLKNQKKNVTSNGEEAADWGYMSNFFYVCFHVFLCFYVYMYIYVSIYVHLCIHSMLILRVLWAKTSPEQALASWQDMKWTRWTSLSQINDPHWMKMIINLLMSTLFISQTTIISG